MGANLAIIEIQRTVTLEVDEIDQSLETVTRITKFDALSSACPAHPAKFQRTVHIPTSFSGAVYRAPCSNSPSLLTSTNGPHPQPSPSQHCQEESVGI